MLAQHGRRLILGSVAPTARRLMSSGTAPTSGPGRLAGRNIFQLRAAAAPSSTEQEAAAAAVAPAPAAAAAAPAVRVSLPTSDESDKLLRIRHSVSGGPRTGIVNVLCAWGPGLGQQQQRGDLACKRAANTRRTRNAAHPLLPTLHTPPHTRRART